jgi:enoyl-[acyl-carrier-protein] reductase (NADH)
MIIYLIGEDIISGIAAKRGICYVTAQVALEQSTKLTVAAARHFKALPSYDCQIKPTQKQAVDRL